jgi:hypothetical protein
VVAPATLFQVRTTWALPGVAVRLVGAAGGACGVADASFDRTLSPAELTAVTW